MNTVNVSRFMRNSSFFKEASIIANEALRQKDPLGAGIKYALFWLKEKRKKQCNEAGELFSSGLFDMYAEQYAELARMMISQYRKCEDEFYVHPEVNK